MTQQQAEFKTITAFHELATRAYALSPDHRCPQTGAVPPSLSSRWEHERFTPWP